MAQIGFTHKTEPVYDRFERMRRAYEDAHGRTYAPGFLTVLMDRYERPFASEEELKQPVDQGFDFDSWVDSLENETE